MRRYNCDGDRRTELSSPILQGKGGCRLKKGSAVAIILLFAFLSAAVIVRAVSLGTIPEEGSITERAETAVGEVIPGRRTLSNIWNSLRYMTGARTFDGKYIGSDGSILSDIEKPSARVTAESMASISAYAGSHRNSYLCLIPTSANILQQEADSYVAEEIFLNQRELISEYYSALSKDIGTVDVYQSLFNHRNEYIFYHTEKGPTALGGYYIYGELCRKMGISALSIDSFTAAFRGYGFYGSLAEGGISEYAASDFVSLYIGENNKRFAVTHLYNDGTSETASGLFLTDDEPSDMTDMILGGLSPITVISSDREGESLLVFCDGSGKSWLPFMANHYSVITVIDLSQAREEMIEGISAADYDVTLFAYGVDSLTEGIPFEKLWFIG